MVVPPLLILAIGVAVVLLLIVVMRANAFLALICAAIVVSLLAPGEFALKISRVAEAFGTTAGKIGIVIGMAAIIGRCLIDSGAADRIVRAIVRLLGEKRCPMSLMSSGFVLSIPVFFDTVFYLLLPLARSMHRRTGRSYLLLILALGAGASITHSLVPPTPGPLLIAAELGVDLGTMMAVGSLVAICTATVTLLFIKLLTSVISIPMRPIEGVQDEPEPLSDDQLPSLFASLLPIIMPVLMISTHTIASTLAKSAESGSMLLQFEQWTSVIGNANLAMLVSATIALVVLWRQRKPTLQGLSKIVENALMSGGVIILITSAGGAFGAMLKAAEIGPAIEQLVTAGTAQGLTGVKLLLIAYFTAFLIKFAQGSTTVAMITTSAMLAPLIASPEAVGFNPVYVACAIGFGSQCGNWMNDSGFWIFSKMSGLTEVETLKTWTLTVSTLAMIGLGFTILFAKLMPLVY